MTRDPNDDVNDDVNDVTPKEKVRAKSLAQLIDNLIDGNAAPPALEAHDRELLETATAIVATLGSRSLATEQRERIVDTAFELGHAQEQAEAKDIIVALPYSKADLEDGDLASPERRRLPWAVAAVAVAVAAAVSIRAAWPPPPVGGTATASATIKKQPSADVLVGRIARSDSARASFRMDTIYADRLAAYRAGLLHRGGLK